jgi:protein Mpv17
MASRPVLTQAISITVLFGAGDVLAQQLVEKKSIKGHDFIRTGRMAFYGGGISFELIHLFIPSAKNCCTAIWRPAATRWFRFLQTKIVFQNKNLEMITRVAIDQTLFAPTSLFVFLSTMSIMEGSNPSEKLSKSYITTLQKNWMVWPFVQLFNFRFVPLDHRVILVNVVSLGWNCYLSYVNSSTVGSYASPMQQSI